MDDNLHRTRDKYAGSAIALEAWVGLKKPARFINDNPATQEEAVLMGFLSDVDQIAFYERSLSLPCNIDGIIAEEALLLELQDDIINDLSGQSIEPTTKRISELLLLLREKGNLRQVAFSNRSLYGMGQLSLDDIPINDAAGVACAIIASGLRDGGIAVLESAAKAGSPLAMYEMGLLLQSESKQQNCLRYLIDAYKTGEPRAGLLLASELTSNRGVDLFSTECPAALTTEEQDLIVYAARGGNLAAFSLAGRILKENDHADGNLFTQADAFVKSRITDMASKETQRKSNRRRNANVNLPCKPCSYSTYSRRMNSFLKYGDRYGGQVIWEYPDGNKQSLVYDQSLIAKLQPAFCQLGGCCQDQTYQMHKQVQHRSITTLRTLNNPSTL